MPTFVNDPLMWDFIAWISVMVLFFGLFGNYQTDLRAADGTRLKTDKQKKYTAFWNKFTNQKRWVLFGLLNLVVAIPAGMYIALNATSVDTHETDLGATEYDKRLYQSRRNWLMFAKYILAMASLVAIQLYKWNAINKASLKKDMSSIGTTTEVQGYEQMTVHFNWPRIHYFADDKATMALDIISSLVLVANVGAHLAVFLHSGWFSSTGVSTVNRWYELTSGPSAMIAILFFCLVRLSKYLSGSQMIMFNPEAAVGHEHPDPKLPSFFDIGIPTVRVLLMKIPPMLILAYSFAELGFGMVFFNDYGTFSLFALIVVVFPHMVTSMLRTHASWYNVHAFATCVYGMMWFMMPAINTMRNGIAISATPTAANDEFIPTGVDRHLMLPQEYRNADHIYRTHWTTDYGLTSLFQANMALMTVMCMGGGVIIGGLMLVPGTNGVASALGGLVQVPSNAELFYFAPLESHRNNLFSNIFTKSFQDQHRTDVSAA